MISEALQYLLWFLGRNERNKCGGVPKWLYMVVNLKKKMDFSKRPSEKKKKFWKKKWSWTKAKRKKKLKKRYKAQNLS